MSTGITKTIKQSMVRLCVLCPPTHIEKKRRVYNLEPYVPEARSHSLHVMHSNVQPNQRVNPSIPYVRVSSQHVRTEKSIQTIRFAEGNHKRGIMYRVHDGAEAGV